MTSLRLSGTSLLHGLSFFSLYFIWVLVSTFFQTDLLPHPHDVFARIGEEIKSGELWLHCIATLGRVAAAFVLAMFIGCCIGLIMGRGSRLNAFFDPWLLLFLNLPALVVILLCYLWIGLDEVAAILAVAINKIPNVAVTIREGARALDPGLGEMGRIYRLSPIKMLRNIILPQLYPFVAAAARSGLALIWKIVLVVELLGRSNGVGFQLHLFFQLFDVTGILAYSLAFISIIWVIEYGLIRSWEKRATRWRGSA